MPLGCGSTFLLPKSADAIEHLWIVTTEPEGDQRVAVCVNVTSIRPYSERTVILKPGEHPFVVHESVVNYADASHLELAKVEQIIATKNPQRFVCKQLESCSPELLQKVQDGLLQSKNVKHAIKEYCRQKWKR